MKFKQGIQWLIMEVHITNSSAESNISANLAGNTLLIVGILWQTNFDWFSCLYLFWKSYCTSEWYMEFKDFFRKVIITTWLIKNTLAAGAYRLDCPCTEFWYELSKSPNLHAHNNALVSTSQILSYALKFQVAANVTQSYECCLIKRS